MKVVPPKKPHFFKPILPGFKNGLKIPKGFLKYLKGQDQKEHAVLRMAGKKWLVKLKGQSFEEGWRQFAEEHELQLGNILVFRHEGNMEFDVLICGSSQCDREYAEYLQEQETFRKFESKEKPEEPKSKNTAGKAFPDNTDMHLNGPHFICTIGSYSLSRHCLSIPQQFVRENRLNNRKCKVLVRDKRRSWTFTLYTCRRCNLTYFGRGWHEFCIANCLKEGDRLRFELVSNGETPTFRFYELDLRGSQSLQPEAMKEKKDDHRIPDKDLHFQEQTDLKIKTSDATAPKSQEPADDDANPHFISTIKPYTINYSVLYLPMAFAKSNELLSRTEMKLVDEKRRSWPVQLGSCSGGHFGIKKTGWTLFMKANNVRAGDTYKFELINNGTIPVAHFHCKYSRKDDKNHISNSQENEAVGDGQGKEH